MSNTKMTPKQKEDLKKKAREFAAFITDIAEVMQKHKVDDLLAVFKLNGEIRNTYIPLVEEKEMYCTLSDGINSFLITGGCQITRRSEIPKTKSQQP